MNTIDLIEMKSHKWEEIDPYNMGIPVPNDWNEGRVCWLEDGKKLFKCFRAEDNHNLLRFDYRIGHMEYRFELYNLQ